MMNIPSASQSDSPTADSSDNIDTSPDATGGRPANSAPNAGMRRTRSVASTPTRNRSVQHTSAAAPFRRDRPSAPAQQSYGGQGGAHLERAPATAVYSAGVRKCPGCDSYAYVTTGECPECGDDLNLQPRIIRCSRCGQSANSTLVICPHCARDLKAAPSRLWTVGAPALLVLLFGILITGGLNGFSLSTNALSGTSLALSTNGEPLRVLTPVPPASADSAGAEGAASEAVVTDTHVANTDEANTDEAAATNQDGAEDEIALAQLPGVTEVTTTEPTTTETGDDASAAGAEVTLVVASAAVSENGEAGAGVSTEPATDATAAALENADAARDATAEVTAEVTDEVTVAEEESRGIGGRATGSIITETEANTDPNGDAGGEADAAPASEDAFVVQAASALMPTSGAPDDNGEASIYPTIEYSVQTGDTLVGIASRHGTTVSDILALNNMNEQDALRIRAGDVLAVSDRRASRRATPTPMPPMPAGSGPVEDSGNAYTLAAPALRSPANGSVFDCAVAEKLTWSPVPYMEAAQNYILHLGFVAGRNADGSDRITWVLAQPRPANITSWEMDRSLCPLAPTEQGRQWRWWVEVADWQGSTVESMSPPSEVWTFIWD